VALKEQDRWTVEGNIVRFENQLKSATDEKQRDQLRGLLAGERERHGRLPPGD
jgi:hypothetical protein